MHLQQHYLPVKRLTVAEHICIQARLMALYTESSTALVSLQHYLAPLGLLRSGLSQPVLGAGATIRGRPAT
jgi:hypothetical protein